MTTSTGVSSRPAIAQQLAAQLQDSGELTADGISWLLGALDPFSAPVEYMGGFPDMMSSKSVVMEKVATLTLSGSQLANGVVSFYLCPYSTYSQSYTNSTLPCFTMAAQTLWPTWGTNGTFTTIIGQSQLGIGTLIDTTVNAAPYYSGGLVINTAGPDPNLTSENGYMTSFTTDPLMVLNHGITSPHRVIGMGFEVVNETAPLYQSGNVVVYENPSNITSNQYGFVMTGLNNSVNPAVGSQAYGFVASLPTYMGPPINQGMMMAQLTSKQWAAKHGAYCVAKMCTMDAPVRGSLYSQQMPTMGLANTTGTGFTPGAFTGASGGSAISVVLQGNTQPVTSSTFEPLVAYCKSASVYPYNFNGCGAFFTGLDTANTSLTVTVRWLVEVFPSALYDPSLISLASVSPGFDPTAMEVYGKVATRLPPGLPAMSSYAIRIPNIIQNANG